MQTKTNHNGTARAEASGPKKSMKERIAMLQSRRWKIVLEELLEAIQNSKAAEVTVDLVDLILIFGTTFRRAPERWGSSRRGWLWPWLDNCRKTGYPVDREVKDSNLTGFLRPAPGLQPEKDRNEALWAALKPVICDQLRGFYKVSDIVGENVVQDILRVAKLIAFPAEARKATADFTLKVPRTWGKDIDPHTLLPVLKKAA